MTQQIINIGSVADDGTGDTLVVGGDKINDNFTELYSTASTNSTNITNILNGNITYYSFSGTTENLTTARPFADYTGTTSNTTVNLPTAVGNTNKTFSIRNSATTGIVIIDGNASETIDGLTTFCLYPNHSITIISNGANWVSIAKPIRQLLSRQVASSSASISLAFPTALSVSQFSKIEVDFVNVSPATDTANLNLRLSTDNGSTYLAGASDYAYIMHNTSITATAISGSAGTTGIIVGASLEALGNLGLTGNLQIHGMFDSGTGTSTNSTLLGINGADSTIRQQLGTGLRLTNEVNNGIQFIFGSGNINKGTFTFYGIS